MNATSSGVASSAAKIRSPSFSRSSSSTTTTGRPAVISAIARLDACRAAPAGCAHRAASQQSLDVLGDHVDLQVDRVPRARARRAWSRAGWSGIRLTSNQARRRRRYGADGQRDAVDGDRALLDDVAGEVGRAARCARPPSARRACGPSDRADAVDVALHDVPAEPGVGGDGALEVDRVAGGQRARGCCGRSVSAMTSARPDAVRRPPVTVRQTPLTAIESPRATSCERRAAARIVQHGRVAAGPRGRRGCPALRRCR